MKARTSRTNRVSVYADNGKLLARYHLGQITESAALTANSEEAREGCRRAILRMETLGFSSTLMDAYEYETR